MESWIEIPFDDRRDRVLAEEFRVECGRALRHLGFVVDAKDEVATAMIRQRREMPGELRGRFGDRRVDPRLVFDFERFALRGNQRGKVRIRHSQLYVAWFRQRITGLHAILVTCRSGRRVAHHEQRRLGVCKNSEVERQSPWRYPGKKQVPLEIG